MRHGDGGILMRHQDGPRHLGAALGRSREALDDRGKVGAGIGEEIIDAMRREALQQGIGRVGLVRALGGIAVHDVSLGFSGIAVTVLPFGARRQGRGGESP